MPNMIAAAAHARVQPARVQTAQSPKVAASSNSQVKGAELPKARFETPIPTPSPALKAADKPEPRQEVETVKRQRQAPEATLETATRQASVDLASHGVGRANAAQAYKANEPVVAAG